MFCQNPSILTIVMCIHFPKFTTKAASIQVGHCQLCAFFVNPITVVVHGLHFEIYTLISETHSHIELVFGIKN